MLLISVVFVFWPDVPGECIIGYTWVQILSDVWNGNGYCVYDSMVYSPNSDDLSPEMCLFCKRNFRTPCYLFLTAPGKSLNTLAQRLWTGQRAHQQVLLTPSDVCLYTPQWTAHWFWRGDDISNRSYFISLALDSGQPCEAIIPKFLIFWSILTGDGCSSDAGESRDSKRTVTQREEKWGQLARHPSCPPPAYQFLVISYPDLLPPQLCECCR